MSTYEHASKKDPIGHTKNCVRKLSFNANPPICPLPMRTINK